MDCWGTNVFGQLGNGSTKMSDVPVAVEGIGGTGTLSGVASLRSNGEGMCALLTSGGMDCWGDNTSGQLGDGSDGNSDVPSAVKGLGGTGTLSGVASLAAYQGWYGRPSWCVVLTSGGVDCWGWEFWGQLGNGVDLTLTQSSNVPVAVEGVGGVGTLTGVASLDSQGYNGTTSYCALLKSGGVDCWGIARTGELGGGALNPLTRTVSAVPEAVKGVGGTGTLSGVASLISNLRGYCAVLTSGDMDCWGNAEDGEMGNGELSGSFDVPQGVEGIDGTGNLSGVAGVVGEDNASDCAVLSSGGVDCWGSGNLHETGNSFDADAPIPVSGVGGIGTFSGAVSVAATAAGLGAEGSTVCAVLTSGGVDCWYGGRWGTLGNGLTSTSAVPVRVVDTTGTGTLSGVVAVQGGEYDHSFCATLTSGRVACWGYGETGEMGNGTEFQTNDVPVYVRIPSVNTAPAFTADSPPTTATAGDL